MEPVLCTLSHAGSDVRCAVCGQGFLVFWSRLTRAEKTACRRVIQDHLRSHHVTVNDTHGGRRIHPREPFPIPEWTGLPEAVAEGAASSMEEVA